MADSLPPGGADFITEREAICKQQKTPQTAFTRSKMRLQTETDARQKRYVATQKIISVYKMHVNVSIFFFPYPGFTAEIEVTGLLSVWKNMKQL